MEAVVLGCNGMLGKELCRQLQEQGKSFVGFSHADLDITSWDDVKDCDVLWDADTIFNCAAYTSVDNAEKPGEESKAILVNSSVSKIVNVAQSTNALLVHVSTDYVFNGKDKPLKETDGRVPVNVYGRSKLVSEAIVEMSKDYDWLMFRTSWLYGFGKTNFVVKVLNLARKGKVAVVDTEFGTPTFTKDLAVVMIDTAQRRTHLGTYHCANSGVVSRYEFAKKAIELAGIECDVEPIDGKEAKRRFGLKAKRPDFSALDCSKLQNDFGIEMRSWASALTEYVQVVK